MSYVVAQGFNTHIRRFVAGDPVESDTPLAPYELTDLIGRGFVQTPPGLETADATGEAASEVEPPTPASKVAAKRGP